MKECERIEGREPTTDASPLRLWWALAALVVVVTAAVYARTVNESLYLDDHHHVRPWTFGEVLGTFHGPFDPLGLEPVYFRPLTVVTFALDWAVWGWNPSGFHLTNVALHAISSVLVLFLLRRVNVPAWAAVAGALLFAIIPANVATAVYVSERSDALVAIFTILGLLAVGRYLDDRRAIWLVALNACFLLAIGSKEVGIAMIPLVALFWWFLNVPPQPAATVSVVGHWRTEARLYLRPFTDRSGRPEWLHLLGPMVVVSLVTVGYRALVLPTGALSKRYSDANPLKAFLSAAGHTFQMVPWELPAAAAPVLALLTIVAFVAAPTSRGWRVAVLGVLWVGGTCVPLAWLGQVEPRLLYVAEIGVAAFFGGLIVAVADAVARAPRPLRVVRLGFAAAFVTMFALLSLRGTFDAQDEFKPGSSKMLTADLQIWTDTPERRQQWPAHWMPHIRERLLNAGLIAEDGWVMADSPAD